ncbi:MAG: hypothetical protein H6765_00250 [Candidatus Peribacteria bacterium]|nr:MAG: hypothetical protein H6765_00250 [Candidatus Peribacteria bacterium]
MTDFDFFDNNGDPVGTVLEGVVFGEKTWQKLNNVFEKYQDNGGAVPVEKLPRKVLKKIIKLHGIPAGTTHVQR